MQFEGWSWVLVDACCARQALRRHLSRRPQQVFRQGAFLRLEAS